MGADHRGPDDLSGPPIRTKNDLIERIPEANAAGAGSPLTAAFLRPTFPLDTGPIGS